MQKTQHSIWQAGLVTVACLAMATGITSISASAATNEPASQQDAWMDKSAAMTRIYEIESLDGKIHDQLVDQQKLNCKMINGHQMWTNDADETHWTKHEFNHYQGYTPSMEHSNYDYFSPQREPATVVYHIFLYPEAEGQGGVIRNAGYINFVNDQGKLVQRHIYNYMFPKDAHPSYEVALKPVGDWQLADPNNRTYKFEYLTYGFEDGKFLVEPVKDSAGEQPGEPDPGKSEDPARSDQQPSDDKTKDPSEKTDEQPDKEPDKPDLEPDKPAYKPDEQPSEQPDHPAKKPDTGQDKGDSTEKPSDQTDPDKPVDPSDQLDKKPDESPNAGKGDDAGKQPDPQPGDQPGEDGKHDADADSSTDQPQHPSKDEGKDRPADGGADQHPIDQPDTGKTPTDPALPDHSKETDRPLKPTNPDQPQETDKDGDQAIKPGDDHEASEERNSQNDDRQTPADVNKPVADDQPVVDKKGSTDPELDRELLQLGQAVDNKPSGETASLPQTGNQSWSLTAGLLTLMASLLAFLSGKAKRNY